MSADLDGSPGRRGITAIAIGAVAIDSALLGLVAPLLPEIQARTGAGDEAVGLALAAYAVPIALFSLPLGRAADAVGRRKLLVAGLALVAAGSVLVAVTHSVGALMAARGVQGLGSAASWISALALVSDSAPPGGRGQALGKALTATGIGSIVGPALGGVTADLLSFEAPFLIAAGCALVLLVAALIVLPPEAPRPRSTTPAFATILGACRSGAGAWAAAMIVITSFVLGLIEVVAPLDLDGRRRLRPVRRALGRSRGPGLPRVRRPARHGAVGRAARRPSRGGGDDRGAGRLRRRLQPRDLGGRPVAGRSLCRG